MSEIRHLSEKEQEVYNFLISVYSKKIIINTDTVIEPYFLKFYLPDQKLAIEFNDLTWDNELYHEKKYFHDKTELCEEKGLRIFHIWEDDWNIRPQVIKSMLIYKMGLTPRKIFARKCQIKELPDKDSKKVSKFLDDNHLQGHIGSAVKLGLYLQNELVSLMTLGKKRKFMNSSSTEGEYELLRFCSLLNTNVIGGANRLWQYFLKTYQPKEVVTYADRSHSDGLLYRTLGFNYDGKTDPNYYYIIEGVRKHRFGFRKDVLVKKYGPETASQTEHEIMLERKIYRIFNAGNLKFSYYPPK